ncbi:MAG: AAA family ATPase [Bacteroidales bacterium]|nr:AAA family ATPase [Bacteroidales bacterium]
MGRSDFLYSGFLSHLHHDPTPCQDSLLRKVADFVSSDEDDIMIVNGYAGTGKTTAVSAVISVMKQYGTKCVLLAPTGRAAKVLSSYAGQPAYTIHKHIYRQKSVGGDGFGQFTLAPNKDKETLFVVDEVSLIGIDAGQQQSSTAFGSGNLLEDLITFVRSGVECKVIMIGDSAQLSPIGLDASPALSKDYMAMMGGTVFAEMTTVVRQQKESGILYNATLIRQLLTELEYGPGVMDLCDLGLEVSPFDDVERIGGGELIEKISDAYARYGEDETVILCRSNRRAIKYNLGVRSTVQFKEERLVRDDKLMIVKNCYQFVENIKDMDYIANGDIAKLIKISKYEERYGLHFAEARISFPDYDDQEIVAKVILDTLESESASLTYEQSNLLYQGVNEDYSHITTKKKRYEAVREDKYYNALQLKYANAVTCHKSQGGQWKCVFIDNPFWQEELTQDDLTQDDLKWLYTAMTRATEKVYLVNFKDELFESAP